MQTSLVTPIVAFIALVLQLFFGIDLTDEQINIAVDGFVAITLAVATVYTGIKAFKAKASK